MPYPGTDNYPVGARIPSWVLFLVEGPMWGVSNRWLAGLREP